MDGLTRTQIHTHTQKKHLRKINTYQKRKCREPLQVHIIQNAHTFKIYKNSTENSTCTHTETYEQHRQQRNRRNTFKTLEVFDLTKFLAKKIQKI